jgi:heme A synthase
MATVGSQLLLLMAIAGMYRYDWPLAEGHPGSWLARSLVLLLMALVLSAALVTTSRRAWQRIDWARQPPLPSLALQQDGSPSRFGAR